jgi:ribosomal protein L11 methyltransferase
MSLPGCPPSGAGPPGDAQPYPAGWLVLSVLAPAAGEEFLMLEALRRLGARAVTREGQRVSAWLEAPPDLADLLREAEATLRLAARAPTDPALTWRWEAHEEWAEAWSRTVEPRRITDRLVVAPVGREVRHEEGDVVIRLAPGMAFGTAEHATTRGCLRLLEAVLQSGDRVVDIGSGSGILAVAAALLGASHVLALEADPLACTNARRNVAVNGVANRVEVREMTVAPADLQALPAADVILGNLEAGLLVSLLDGLRNALAAQGALIVSGITGGERPGFMEAAAAAGFHLHRQEVVEGWWCAAFRIRRADQAS